jgi:basic membrane protein A and related proteins
MFFAKNFDSLGPVRLGEQKEKNVNSISRRNFLQTAAAGLSALPALGRGAFAAEPLKVGFIFLGPIGDYGWTWAHNKGRLAMDTALKGQVVSSYVENVKEDASAVPILKDLAQNGSQLIFTTSYGYMDQTIEVAKQFPKVMFEHCTGYKHADNVGTYNSRFHQGRAVEGTIAGLMSKSGTIGYLGSYKVPEVVLGVNSFTLSAQAVNPNIKTKLVMIDSWFDPAKEAAAVQTLINLGCDVVAQHTDSPAGLQVCEQRKVWCFGQGADMSRFAPKTQATGIEDIWGPYYTSRAKAMLDGSWKPDDAWWGFKEGTVVMSPYNKALPDNVKAAADKIIAGWKDGAYDVFTGPIADQDGKERVTKGQRMEDKDLAVIDWYVKGVQS